MTMTSTSAFVLKHWREAATLIIVSPTASTQRSKLSYVLTSSKDELMRRSEEKTTSIFKDRTQDYDLLLLQRSSKSKFMPNNFVFPGGVAADSDFSPEWLSVFRKLGENLQLSLFNKLTVGSAYSAPLFQRQRDSRFSQIPAEVAFRLTAIRETFEESGVLIASPLSESCDKIDLDLPPPNSLKWTFSPSLGPAKSPILKRWRERVIKNPDEFLKMCKELDIIPAVWTLHEWSNWLTPVAAIQKGRRFDTMFFICCLDHKPKAFEDAAEMVNSVWAQPGHLLSGRHEGQLHLAEPQVYEISRMMNFNHYNDLMVYAAEREKQRVERWLPIFFVSKDYDRMSIMPGDDLYPKDPKESETVPVIQSDKTLAELCQEYPRCHRTYIKKDKSAFPICICNIDLGRGQVSPVTLFDDDLDLKSKL